MALPPGAGATSKRSATPSLVLPPTKRGPAQQDLRQSHQLSSSFPCFDDGDVVIQDGSSIQVFRLHSSVLARHSPYFSKAIQTPNAPSIWHDFTIEETNGSLIYRGQKNGRISLHAVPHNPLNNSVPIKLEGEGKGTRDDILKCYSAIFALLYNLPLSTCTSNTSISNALGFVEQVVHISIKIGCLQPVRPHLGRFLSEYRQTLFVAIKDDPLRWIKLGEQLEDKAIYAECLVHLIGAYPRWPWTTVRPNNTRLLEIIREKSREIEQLWTLTERDLLFASLPYEGRALDPTKRDQAETWLVVSVFRDELAQKIHELNPNDHIEVSSAVWKRGTFFRSLSKGTFEPLDGERVRRVCQKIMRADWSDLLEDLHHLKEYAKAVVHDLAVNELMIDPDANGVGYLTCVKIRDKDIPWIPARREESAQDSS